VNDRVTSCDISIASLMAKAADEFLDQLDRGELPEIAEYARRYPQIAGVLPEVLPALRAMHAEATGSYDGGCQGLGASAKDDLFGDYRIVREVGRGGMGIVYEAEQLSLDRRVALKILPTAAAMDPQQRARFQIEAQATALLQHPHIVPVYSIGTERGVPYYVMQFIEGQTLATVIRDLRLGKERGAVEDNRHDRLMTDPVTILRRLSPTLAFVHAVARLGIEAAEALDHAHRQGVLHRDIKPANLLLDHRGHIWVADFGLARLASDANLTESGDLLGTLRYMSPEQALAKRAFIDHRTDIYSLGATLYELLTLEPLFDATDRQELLRRLGEEEPAPPRRRNPALPRDIETVVLKAIAKDPGGRYASAREFADDLRRFLNDEPIHARRASLLDHAVRWSRRHKQITAIAGTAMVLATIFGSAMIWREERKAAQALHVVQAARRREREALRFTFAASDQVAARALAKLAAPGAIGKGQDAAFCRKALAYYAAIADQYQTDGEMRAIVAAAWHRVGFIRMILGESLAEARAAYRQAIPIYESLVTSSHRSVETRIELASALDDFGLLCRRSQALSEAETYHRQALELRQGLVMDFPSVHNYRLSLAYADVEYVAILDELGRAIDAAQARHRLWDDSELAMKLNPIDGQLCNSLSWLLAAGPGGLPKSYQRAVELAEKAVTDSPSKRAFWNTLGVARYRAGGCESAAAALERSMRLQDGGDPYDWLFLAMIHHRLGDKLQSRDWYDRSLSWIVSLQSGDNQLHRIRVEAEGLLGGDRSSSDDSPKRRAHQD
jgi:eukaryotic-like serine/threonine-protein kinase